jgi:hypothetical protein
VIESSIEIVATFFNLTLQILPVQKQKSRVIAGAAFVNRDQALGSGCDRGIADMNGYHKKFLGFHKC